MAYRSLRDFILRLESEGELHRVDRFVSPRLEITEIADRMVKSGGRALLFTSNGTSFPLLINAFASDHRICLALGVNNLDEIGERMETLFRELLGPKETFLDKLRMLPRLKEISSWMPVTLNRRGACQEVIMDNPDLTRLPVLTCWPADGGPFITLPCVHTRDPETKLVNLGMYRMQVFGPDLTGMHWHLHKGSAHHFTKHLKSGTRMPVAVTLGGDPVYTYAATAPLPENIDEYLLAGFLRKKRVRMVPCLTCNLQVPEDVDFVIEGYIDPNEELLPEGPFGDHTGFYSLTGLYPSFHVTCITHRRDAVYPATIVGIPPQEDAWLGKATERIFRSPIKMTVAPEIRNIHMPAEGVFHNIVLASIDKAFPGHAPKVMSSLWGAGQMMFNKIMCVLGQETDLYDYWSVARIISENTDPLNDIHFLQGPVDILDHSSRSYAYGSKIGLDATVKLPGEPLQTEQPGRFNIEEAMIREAFPAIKNIRSDLPGAGVSVVLMTIEKSGKSQIRQTATAILRSGWIRNAKFLVFLDPGCNLQSLSQVVWIAANNLDPVRDCFFVEEEPGVRYPVLFLDGTRKNLENDGFARDWPNVITMDDETINKIDAAWKDLLPGPFIPSPSLQFKSLVISKGAIS